MPSASGLQCPNCAACCFLVCRAAGVLDGLQQYTRGEELLAKALDIAVVSWGAGSMQVCRATCAASSGLRASGLGPIVHAATCMRARLAAPCQALQLRRRLLPCAAPVNSNNPSPRIPSRPTTPQHLNVLYALAQHFRRREMLQESIDFHEQVGARLCLACSVRLAFHKQATQRARKPVSRLVPLALHPTQHPPPTTTIPPSCSV